MAPNLKVIIAQIYSRRIKHFAVAAVHPELAPAPGAAPGLADRGAVVAVVDVLPVGADLGGTPVRGNGIDLHGLGSKLGL